MSINHYNQDLIIFNMAKISKKFIFGGDNFRLKGGYRFKETGNVSSKACLISTDAKSEYDSEVYRLSKTVWKKPDGHLEFTAVRSSAWDTFNKLIERVGKEARDSYANFVNGMFPGVVVVQESNGNVVYSAKQPGVSITAAQVLAELNQVKGAYREIRINMSGSVPQVDVIRDSYLDLYASQVYGMSRMYGAEVESDDSFRQRMLSAWSNDFKSKPLTKESLEEVINSMEASIRKPIAKFHIALGKKEDI